MGWKDIADCILNVGSKYVAVIGSDTRGLMVTSGVYGGRSGGYGSVERNKGRKARTKERGATMKVMDKDNLAGGGPIEISYGHANKKELALGVIGAGDAERWRDEGGKKRDVGGLELGGGLAQRLVERVLTAD